MNRTFLYFNLFCLSINSVNFTYQSDFEGSDFWDAESILSLNSLQETLSEPFSLPKSRSEFFNAIIDSDVETIQSLIIEDKKVLSEKDDFGNNCMHYYAATYQKEEGIFDLFLKMGVNPTEKNNQLRTPLMIAVERQNLNAIEKLAPYGINEKDANGKTSLHYAVLADNLITVSYLLSHGAKKNSKDNYKRKPADYAQVLKKDEILNALNGKKIIEWQLIQKGLSVPEIKLKQKNRECSLISIKSNSSKNENGKRNGIDESKLDPMTCFYIYGGRLIF